MEFAVHFADRQYKGTSPVAEDQPSCLLVKTFYTSS